MALLQIWSHADTKKTGFLGRTEFYNALKLVSLVQSKRDLTPEAVKGALYGPASATIPAPQINLAALPTALPSTRPPAPNPQFSGTTPAATQITASRGPQSSLPQQNQLRPPQASAPITAFQPHHGVANQMVRGGSPMPASGPPSSSSISSGWLGGGAGGSPAGVYSQVPATNRVAFGPATSGLTTSSVPAVAATTAMTQPATPKPYDASPVANQGGPNDSKALAATGNGFASDPIFGDVFSETSVKQTSTVPASSSGVPVPSPVVPTTVGPKTTVKPSPLGPLHNAQQHPVSQHQQIQSAVKQNQPIPVQSANIFPGRAGNSSSGQPHLQWPKMTQSAVQKYSKVFVEVDTDRDGKITGEQARNLFLSWKLPRGKTC